jgi:hypothetical protein
MKLLIRGFRFRQAMLPIKDFLNSCAKCTNQVYINMYICICVCIYVCVYVFILIYTFKYIYIEIFLIHVQNVLVRYVFIIIFFTYALLAGLHYSCIRIIDFVTFFVVISSSKVHHHHMYTYMSAYVCVYVCVCIYACI